MKLITQSDDLDQSHTFTPLIICKEIPETQMDVDHLSPTEQMRFKEISHPLRKKQYYWGRIFLKKYLSQILNKKESEIEIKVDEFGKAYIENSKIFFSISHSFNKIALVIATSPCGVDIEKFDEEKNYPKLSKKIFNKELPAREFIKQWTLKEALFKTQSQQVHSVIRQQAIDNFMMTAVFCPSK